LSGEPGEAPCIAPGDLATAMASMYASLATMAALIGRIKSGRGQLIDTSLAEAAAHVGGYNIPFYSFHHQKAARVTHKETSFELHDVYECQDGYARLFILVRDHWRAFLEWIGSPEELRDPLFEDQEMRRDNRDLIDPYVIEFCKRFTKLDLYMEGQRRHLAITAMNSPAEFVENAQTRGRDYLVEVEHPAVGRYEQPRAMHVFSESPAELRCAAPLIGQHNDDIFAGELGLSAERIAQLRASGVI
jgi:crotonobetainyl-CoA:carnitine CoA-transferase CaiB-like acyl-CoA transferase